MMDGMSRVAACLLVGGCSFALAPIGSEDAPPVEIDAAIDAALDAPRFDPATCPSTYVTIGTQATRYRAINTASSYWPHEASCNADSTDGSTHAVVLDSLAEAGALRQYLVALAPPFPTFGVGAVQSPAATMVGEGWINFHDQPLEPALWGIYAGVQQPDDGAAAGLPSSEDHLQNVAFLDIQSTGANPFLRDGNGNGGYVFVCECDGIPVGPLARSYVAGDINRPPQ